MGRWVSGVEKHSVSVNRCLKRHRGVKAKFQSGFLLGSSELSFQMCVASDIQRMRGVGGAAGMDAGGEFTSRWWLGREMHWERGFVKFESFEEELLLGKSSPDSAR